MDSSNKDYIEYENGFVKNYKENWEPEEVLELEEQVPSVIEIAIIDSFDDFDPSEKEVEAAKHFRDLQEDRLHPAHSHQLSNLIRRGDE